MDKITLSKLVDKDDAVLHIIRLICKLGYDRPKDINNEEQEIAFMFFGRHVFASITLNSIFWPANPMNISKEIHSDRYYDYPSAFLLIRNLYENYLVLNYLLNQDINPLERELRQLIWKRTAENDKIKFGEYLKSRPAKIAPSKRAFDLMTKILKENKCFLTSVKEGKRKRIINCKDRNLLSFSEMAEDAKLSTNYHKAFYGYCNAYAHPNSLGYNHFIAGNINFMIAQSKKFYIEVSVLLLEFTKVFLFRDDIENKKDEFLKVIMDFYLEWINNFDAINEEKYNNI